MNLCYQCANWEILNSVTITAIDHSTLFSPLDDHYINTCHVFIGHIVPALLSKPLLSIGQFCNAGCQVAFTATTIDICYDNNIVLQDTCTPHTLLWELDLLHPIWPPTQQCQLAIGNDTTADLVAFAHTTLFSPALSTLQEALQQHHLPAPRICWAHPGTPLLLPTKVPGNAPRPPGSESAKSMLNQANR